MSCFLGKIFFKDNDTMEGGNTYFNILEKYSILNNPEAVVKDVPNSNIKTKENFFIHNHHPIKDLYPWIEIKSFVLSHQKLSIQCLYLINKKYITIIFILAVSVLRE